MFMGRAIASKEDFARTLVKIAMAQGRELWFLRALTHAEVHSTGAHIFLIFSPFFFARHSMKC
jgi:hypothetical protein